jgi:hypothetical protein
MKSIHQEISALSLSTQSYAIRNARIVTAEREFIGSMTVDNNLIATISSTPSN